MNAVRLFPLTLIASLAACSGASGPQSPVPAPPAGPIQASKTTAQATLQVVVPLAGRTVAGTTRRPQYISPNTHYLVVTLTSNNGTAIPVAQQQKQTIDITTTSSQCTSSGGTLTCTATIVVPVGNDIFSVVAQDPFGGTLSQNQNVAATIAPTAANVVAMTLNGVVANITVSTTQVNGDLSTQPAPGSAMTIPIAVTAQDCSGATIVGPGSYDTPITLTLDQIPANPSTVSLSETTVNGPSDVVTLAWNGSASTQYATVTPTTMPPCGNRGSSIATGYFLPRPVAPYLWASNSGGYHSGNGNTFLIGYPLAWLHDVVTSQVARPGVEIFAGVNFTTIGVAVDHAGNIYTDVNTSSGPEIFKYAAGSTGNVPPTQIISNALVPADAMPNQAPGIASLACDPSGNLFVVRGEFSGTMGQHNTDVLELSGNYASASVIYNDANNRTLNGYDTASLAVDASDNVFAIEETNSGYGTAVPTTVLKLSAGGAQGFALGKDSTGAYEPSDGLTTDGNGNVLVASRPAYTGNTSQQGLPTVTSYPYASVTSGSGAGTVLFTAPGGTSATAAGPNGVARDAQGYIYLADNAGFVSVYAPGTSGSAATPIGFIRDAFDPTTSTKQMVVPAGVTPPGYSLSAIAVQI